MKTERLIEWQFGGWHGLDPRVGWAGLVLAAMAGVVFALWLYRDTLRALTARQRLVFAGLRIGFFLSLLLCLANPTRVERTYDSAKEGRPLAVITDRSQSMSMPDPRGLTRLAAAVRTWKKVEGDAMRSFPKLNYFTFSSALDAAPDLEAAATRPEAGESTHFYESLGQAMKNAPAGGYGGIVCLTDGLDTTEATAEELAAGATQNHSPLYFVVGENRSAKHETLMIRELAAPGQVLRKSQFTATAVIEAHSTRDHDVPLTLTANDQPIAETTLHLRAGANLIPWSTPINAAEPGLMRVTCRFGTGAEQETLTSSVRVVASERVRILFYQGTLDWSFRFINSALQGEESFALNGIFNPSLNITQVVSATGEATLTRLPEKSDGLEPFQIVVLSNVVANELTRAQQSALLNYVQGGGGLLFLVSDNEMAQTFSGTDLENALPVIFEAARKPEKRQQAARNFQDLMSGVGGDNDVYGAPSAAPDADDLKNFALPAGYQRSKIAALFAPGAGATMRNVPQFSTYARVRGVKPGGEILAIHPEDRTEGNQPRPLLVTQRFGKGQVTTLLTDTLWRWRLSLPSDAHDPEVFWQQLFLALARNKPGKMGMRFAAQPFSAGLGQTCAFQVNSSLGANAPGVMTVAPGGDQRPVAVQPGPEAGSWAFQVVPTSAGTWRVQADDGRGAQVETLLRVSNVSHSNELSGLPADRDGLKKLAESTGGSLLNDGVPEHWSNAGTPDQATLVSNRAQPLWNNWIVLLVGLCFYATELIWRRAAKLL